MKTIITVGIPASGKTTWAKEFVKTNPDYVRVSRDDFRMMLSDTDKPSEKIEKLINGLMVKTIIKCLTKFNVIVDATHVKLSYINDIVKEIGEHCDVEFMIFDADFFECLKRNENRERKVPVDVMHRMKDNLEILRKNFNFEPIPKKIIQRKENNPKLPNAVIIDIDGTMAIMGNRSPFEWHKVGLDSVCEQVALLARFFYSNYVVFLVSGRDEVCRPETEQWLKQNNIEYHHLLMRKANDFRKDSIVKKEIYDANIKDQFNVFCVIDDRLQVLDMWYKQGCYTLSANQGQKEF